MKAAGIPTTGHTVDRLELKTPACHSCYQDRIYKADSLFAWGLTKSSLVVLSSFSLSLSTRLMMSRFMMISRVHCRLQATSAHLIWSRACCFNNHENGNGRTRMQPTPINMVLRHHALSKICWIASIPCDICVSIMSCPRRC